MFFRGGVGGLAAAGMSLVRQFSRKCAPDVRRINPKVPREEAKAISEGLYQIFKEKGPLSVGHTWTHAQEAGVAGLNSKTHMKILLKWMRGRKMLKLFCTHHGSNKRFFHTIFTDEGPQPVQQKVSAELKAENDAKPSTRQAKKELKKQLKKKKIR
ncbi:uncharacterized protein M6B38_267765 [Iris pallida]|uniref:Uncharacterized protein n=1 Tax=Iris pallida TaxID=29817 RepID=A0AAX6I9J9_IRIPA|nr:uncharacterized protein M6B38_267765 [Iris pallida]